ncbi:Lrp/AsnC family transcriptional regulator [Nakamurella antarctica]|uniref:Lrp/AsnC family transcriptional regulator n=1 Tax=Nakamurella antarctica TaxID=1902245 RepID=A0A3G8ZT03_9ACTN|nr:Lrp/AsnC family transcriptional regulator [Nakamurella antarctica]AZI57624.1 Lrp/AsnC family transcriptional regulator [Nakamurella antarctica]
MTSQGSTGAQRPAPGSQNIRPTNGLARGEQSLSAVDRHILLLLARDARMPNNALAAEVGIAPSTCLARIRAMRESGTIRGYHANIDQTALGQGLQALIAVRLQSGARDQIESFVARIRECRQVQSVFFLAGANDFLLHVGAADAQDLRDFVVQELSAHPEVALTETNLIFEHQRGVNATTR